jgi:hypothetical protein
VTRSRRRERSSTGRATKHRAPRVLPWLLIAALLVAAVVAWSWWRGRGSQDAAGEKRADNATGYVRLARAAEGRQDYAGAFALYREGLRHFPDDVFLLGSYGAATTNASYGVRRNRGRLVPVMATSRDRVRAAHEALVLLDRAQAAAPAMSAPALQKGLMLAAWGLPEDALVELYGAVVRGDRSPELERTAGAITLLQLGRADSLGQNGRPASR